MSDCAKVTDNLMADWWLKNRWLENPQLFSIRPGQSSGVFYLAQLFEARVGHLKDEAMDKVKYINPPLSAHKANHQTICLWEVSFVVFISSIVSTLSD